MADFSSTSSRSQRRALLQALDSRADLEVVAGEQSVLVLAPPGRRKALAEEVRALDLRRPVAADDLRAHVIPVHYDGADLAAVAEVWGCAPEAVADRHALIPWTVEFLGFTPGFGYLVTDVDLPQMPRRESPRTRIPAGSVALAAHYCGIYPHATPGGWQLIGRADVTLFDPTAQDPALLHPGDTVRFIPA
ncbi:5-oxoprolinase subunit B family protein [Branchiibius cervicis]|uniref:Allophanate hydrolase subunit 1 n=1 Tax=Branchiibius cervicis TaxID=908252 RepID=A0ABW2APQ5_9MICO